MIRAAVFAVLLVATSAGANPVAKVIKLLEDLKKGVETDGKTEGAAYAKYACFCKDTTSTKSKSITKGEDTISTLSADITDNTASKEAKEAEVKERKETHEQLGTELSGTVTRCSTAQAEASAGEADMSKAVDSLNKAIKAMKAKQDAAAAIKLASLKTKVKKTEAKSFLELDEDVQRGLVVAKVDPSDPAYKYHSKEINDILAKCLKDFKEEKQDGIDKWTKTQTACQKEKDGLNKKMKDNLDAITKAETRIDSLEKTIAKDRGSLVKSQEDLEDDAAYLKSLTSQCEQKANDFDQRAQTRNDEITALAGAIKIISNKVTDADKVNRDFVQIAAKPVSFLQAAPIRAVTTFLAKSSTSEQAKQTAVVALLRTEGSRLASAELSTMAMRVNGPDHFKEVKSMIQKLINRLLDEAKADISKKGFCDEELAKGQKDRDVSQSKAEGMTAELKDHEATKETLEADLKTLKKEIKEEATKFQDAADLRKGDKEDNEETLKTANEGLDALNDAILILKAFYNERGPRVFLQAPDPVDADTSGPGFSGEYKGSEKKSRAIFALLETIGNDFKKTISETEQSESDAAAAFVEFTQTSKSATASKETKTKLNKQDLKSTNNEISNTLDDLETTMGLQADALKVIEDLKPACLDAGGMNTKARSNKRDEEIAALNKAICMLTEGKKDGECK